MNTIDSINSIDSIRPTKTMETMETIEPLKTLYTNQFSDAWTLSLSPSLVAFTILTLIGLPAIAAIAILESNKSYRLAKLSNTAKEKIANTAVLTMILTGAIVLFKTMSVLKTF